MNRPHVFNIGNPVTKQCAQRNDGVWFVRNKRLDAPGFSAWRIAPFAARPVGAWYDGKKARLPEQWTQSEPALKTCALLKD